jgi:hypothetical protein
VAVNKERRPVGEEWVDPVFGPVRRIPKPTPWERPAVKREAETTVPMTLDEQKFMAFEGLLGWTAAVANQAQRVTDARDKMFAVMARRTDRSPGWTERYAEEVRANATAFRLAQQSFQTERHLFCNAAYKLLEHRRWVQDLEFIDDALFEELDQFARDIDVMRDMNEHAIEYFRGKGRRPHDWVHQDGGGTADASSTVDTKIGGRLDWVELGAAVQRLLARIGPMGPFYPSSPATANATPQR